MAVTASLPCKTVPVATVSSGTAWSTTVNAVDTSTSTAATWTSVTGGATSTISMGGIRAQAALGYDSGAVVTQVDCFINVQYSNLTALASSTVQLYSGTTAIGSAATINRMTTQSERQAIFSATVPTYAQLSDLRVLIFTTRQSGNTTSAVQSVYNARVVITYTPSASPPTAYSLHGATVPFGAAVVGTGGGGVLGKEIAVSQNVFATALKFYRPTTSITGTPVGRIYAIDTDASGDPLQGSDVSFTLSTTGWQQVSFAKPILLQKGSKYRLAIYFPNGRPDATGYYTAAGNVQGEGRDGISCGVLSAPNATNAVGAKQETYDVTSGVGTAGLVYPSTGNSSNGWDGIDIVVDTAATSDIGPTFVRNVGSATNTVSGTTSLVVTVPAGGIGAGSMLIARFTSYSYPSSTDQFDISVTNSKANIFYGDELRNSTSAGANNVWSCINAAGKDFAPGDTFTVNFPVGCYNAVFSIDEYNGITYTSPSDGSWRIFTPTETLGTSTTPSNTATPPNTTPVEALFVGTLFFTGAAADGFTEDTDTVGNMNWISGTPQFTATGTRQMGIRTAHKHPDNTLLSQTWNPTLGTSRTWFEAITIYRGSADRIPTMVQTMIPGMFC